VRFPREAFVGFATAAFAGASFATLAPPSWWNLTFQPWFVTPLTAPAVVLMVIVSTVFKIDIMSDAANPAAIRRLEVATAAIVGGLYGTFAGVTWYWLERRRVSKR